MVYQPLCELYIIYEIKNFDRLILFEGGSNLF